MMSPLLVGLGPACDDALRAATLSGADALVFDLNDASAPGDRAARRSWAKAVLERDPRRRTAPGDGGEAPAVVRIADLASGLVDADLAAVMAGAPEAVLLPGAVGGRDLQHLAAKLAVHEAEHRLPAGRTRIVAVPADTAAGVQALSTLRAATPRLMALAWDAGALAAGLRLDREASPVRAARDLLLIAAAAAGVPAVDCGGFSGDPAAADFARDCEEARRDGFAGRLARSVPELGAIRGGFAPGGPDRRSGLDAIQRCRGNAEIP